MTRYIADGCTVAERGETLTRWVAQAKTQRHAKQIARALNAQERRLVGYRVRSDNDEYFDLLGDVVDLDPPQCLTLRQARMGLAEIRACGHAGRWYIVSVWTRVRRGK